MKIFELFSAYYKGKFTLLLATYQKYFDGFFLRLLKLKFRKTKLWEFKGFSYLKNRFFKL